MQFYKLTLLTLTASPLELSLLRISCHLRRATDKHAKMPLMKDVVEEKPVVDADGNIDDGGTGLPQKILKGEQLA